MGAIERGPRVPVMMMDAKEVPKPGFDNKQLFRKPTRLPAVILPRCGNSTIVNLQCQG
jgi:hypothetical protein